MRPMTTAEKAVAIALHKADNGRPIEEWNDLDEYTRRDYA